jgi:hypothetical protein
MEQRHQEYVEYYRARAKAYEGSPIYTETLAAERALLAAIESATDLDAFARTIEREHPEVRCAIALARDQARAEVEHFTSIDEPVRAGAGEQILTELGPDAAPSAIEVTSTIAAIRDRNRVDVTIDELTRVFEGQLDQLENLEVLATAEVPDEWRADLDEQIADAHRRGHETWTTTVLPEHRRWDPDWTFDESQVWETRFRRRLPIPDAVLERRLAQHREHTGRA